MADRSRLLLCIECFVKIVGAWEYEYLQYYWIIFSHSSAVTIASRVSVADKCQSGKLSILHDFILYVLQLEHVLSV